MFHFSRRTLWIVIYITIPMIILLNNLGPSNNDSSEESTSFVPVAVEQWSLDEVFVDQQDDIGWLLLEHSSLIRLTVISKLLPNSALADEFRSFVGIHQQGGFFVMTFLLSESLLQNTQYLNAITAWMPNSNENRIIVSGGFDDSLKDKIHLLLTSVSGIGVRNEPKAAKGLSILTAPRMGSIDQLAFILWIDILKQRLARTGAELTAGTDLKWDHRTELSTVVINSTLDNDLFIFVTDEELEPILTAYERSAEQRRRDSTQLHRYAVTAAVYNLPFSFFVDQSKRLQQISLNTVNTMRSYSLEQIKYFQ